MIRPLLVGGSVLLGILVACAPSAAIPQADDDSPVSIPLTISQNPYFGTESPQVAIALGNGRTLPFGFDTGSSGLHVFADARLESTDGVQCSHTPTGVTYGNPPRITFSGVVCYAPLRFRGFTTPESVPIAYLTSATCPKTNPSCKIPNLHSPKAMHGYGVFGAGLTGVMYGNGNVPNPIITLPGRRGSVYSVILRHESGELVLGADAPTGAADFHLIDGTLPGERYSLPRTCLFVNGRPIQTCTFISFDTGNGVPWIHAASTGSIPQQDGLVTPGTRLGFAPPGDDREAATVLAGSAFDDSIKVVAVPGKPPLTNVSIQAFFDHIVTYDNARGIISVGAVQR